jgi:hypothetical protein
MCERCKMMSNTSSDNVRNLETRVTEVGEALGDRVQSATAATAAAAVRLKKLFRMLLRLPRWRSLGEKCSYSISSMLWILKEEPQSYYRTTYFSKVDLVKLFGENYLVALTSTHCYVCRQESSTPKA